MCRSRASFAIRVGGGIAGTLAIACATLSALRD
jgi:hypothetical protein